MVKTSAAPKEVGFEGGINRGGDLGIVALPPREAALAQQPPLIPAPERWDRINPGDVIYDEKRNGYLVLDCTYLGGGKLELTVLHYCDSKGRDLPEPGEPRSMQVKAGGDPFFEGYPVVWRDAKTDEDLARIKKTFRDYFERN